MSCAHDQSVTLEGLGRANSVNTLMAESECCHESGVAGAGTLISPAP